MKISIKSEKQLTPNSFCSNEIVDRWVPLARHLSATEVAIDRWTNEGGATSPQIDFTRLCHWLVQTLLNLIVKLPAATSALWLAESARSQAGC